MFRNKIEKDRFDVEIRKFDLKEYSKLLGDTVAIGIEGDVDTHNPKNRYEMDVFVPFEDYTLLQAIIGARIKRECSMPEERYFNSNKPVEMKFKGSQGNFAEFRTCEDCESLGDSFCAFGKYYYIDILAAPKKGYTGRKLLPVVFKDMKGNVIQGDLTHTIRTTGGKIIIDKDGHDLW